MTPVTRTGHCSFVTCSLFVKSFSVRSRGFRISLCYSPTCLQMATSLWVVHYIEKSMQHLPLGNNNDTTTASAHWFPSCPARQCLIYASTEGHNLSELETLAPRLLGPDVPSGPLHCHADPVELQPGLALYCILMLCRLYVTCLGALAGR